MARAKKSSAELSVTVFLGTIKLKLIYKEQLHKNYNRISFPRNFRNISEKSFPFCSKRFQRHGVLKNVGPTTFWAERVGVETWLV